MPTGHCPAGGETAAVSSPHHPYGFPTASTPNQNPRLLPAPDTMDLARQCAMGCLPIRTVTRAGTLSAALLRIIASRLPIKDAERVTALSPWWRRAWRSVPLVLDDTHLAIAGVHETVPVVDHLLTAHPGPFRSVRLTFSFFGGLDDEDEDALARWPRLLAAKGVHELFFINPPPPISMPLPADILRCTELRRLYLGFWEFPDTRCLPDGVGVFPHLREFVLLNTRIEDRDLDQMLASSPALETIALVLSYGLPQHVRLRGQNLRCALFWLSMADELAVVDAPRLERLLMWLTTTPCVLGDSDDSDDEPPIRVRIACAPELKVLGYLDTRIHQLQIGNTVIKVDTEASPSFMIPSVKILALRVDFRVSTEVRMLSSFLRCFPNVETLHVEFSMTDRSTGKHYGEFLSKQSPIECLQSHTKKVVLHEFRGDLSEVVFLQYLTQRVNHLQKLTIVLSKDILLSVDDMKVVLLELARLPWASKSCAVMLVGPKHAWNFHRASDLSTDDPFDSEHGQEFFCFTKEGVQTIWKHQ